MGTLNRLRRSGLDKILALSKCSSVILLSLAVLMEMLIHQTDAEKAKLQIGIKKRVPAEECKTKTKKGDVLDMHYTGKLEDGTKFDSSLDRNQPFKFQIGVGQVIQGWEEGVLGMCVGEKRRLIVPPQLGYGDQGAGDIIPGGATLYFEIELLDTEDGPAPVNVFKQIDLDSDQQLSRE